MQKENRELKEKLDAVINSTWNLSGEGWHSHPNNVNLDLPGNLVLTREDPDRPSSSPSGEVWRVDAAFRDSKKVEDLKAGRTAGFKKKDTWEISKDRSRSDLDDVDGAPGRMDSVRSCTSELSDRERQDEILQVHSCRKRFIMDPTSKTRLAWDIAGMILLLYDLVFIPIGAFIHQQETLQATMDWITLLFWSGDMFASLFTGYISVRGNIIMAPNKIVRNYLQSRWFLLDLVIVVPDWVGTIGAIVSQGNDTAGSEAAGLLRIFRVIRIMRLLRVSKLKRLMTLLQDNIESEFVYFLMRLVQWLIVLLFCGHFMAGGWYYIGENGMSRGLDNRSENWIQAYGVEGRSALYRYLTSLHWALANFAPGASANVFPANSGERFCSVLAVVFGATIICLLTAWTTSALIILQKANDDVNKQFWLLRQYLRQNDVPAPLKIRILRYLNNKLGSNKDLVQESTLEVLGLLSDSLQSDLKYVVSFSDILIHPLFGHVQAKYAAAKHSLARSVLTVKNLAKKEILFERSTIMGSMFFIKSGSLEYNKDSEVPLTVTKDDWLCEMCLWVQWASRGGCRAKTDTEAIVVDSAAFDDMAKQDKHLLRIVSAYAEVFTDWLASLDPLDLSDVFFASRRLSLVEGFLAQAYSDA